MNIPPVTDALLEVDGRVALLTLNRDDVRNALTGTQLIEDIVGVAHRVNRCDDVSVLVITGAGAAFSAGGNVKDMAGRSGDFAGDVAEVAQRYRRGIQRIPLALCEVEVPVIAAVKRCGDRRWLRSGQHGRYSPGVAACPGSARPFSTWALSPGMAAPGSCSG